MIYNSRNYIGLLDVIIRLQDTIIYNSRNYIGLLDNLRKILDNRSTIVEII